MRISTERTRSVTRTLAELGALLLCACSSSIPRSDPAAALDPKDAGAENDGGSRPGLGADAGQDPNDPNDSHDPNQGTPGRPHADAGILPPAMRPSLTCVEPAVGPSPLRRLTHFEYDNSARDLLGDTTAPGTRFAPDAPDGLFDNALEMQTVSVQLAEQYLDAAIALAEAADLGKVVGCDPAGATCLRDFIARFGRRAFRRPLEPAEIDDMLATFSAANTAAGPETGARAVIAAILASPKFIFRPEYGGANSPLPDAKRLTPFELAGRLASLLWASVPDDALLDAAASDELETKEQVEAQARRMLADVRARGAQAAFYEQWFGLARLTMTVKDPAVYPSFDEALRDSMAAETRAFVDHVLWEGDARLETLLTASYAFVNAPLADLYGVSRPSTDALTRAALDPSQRAGVLTQASVLTAFAGRRQSSPVQRGLWVRVRMLCGYLPPPPAVVNLPEVEDGVSNRERFETLTAEPACRGCHHLIDGIGFGLEHYDGIGAYRELDEGLPVDARGEITDTEDIDGPFYGGPELASRLGTSAHVRDCAATQWLRYALGRAEEMDDTCSLVELREAFAAAGGDLQELLVALTQTDAFRSYRQPQ